MLGEKLGELKAKISGTRVIKNDAGIHVMETSFQGQGRILGLEHNEMGTYIAKMQANGTLVGEGQGLIMTKDGETACWTATGIGRPTGKGMGASWRATLRYETTSTKLARLGTIIGLVEWEVDEQGNGIGSTWEWK